MARTTLQVKNIASLILATGASLSWGIFARRFFDTPQRSWQAAAIVGTLCLACQLALLFIESKEEEELSLFRRDRMASLQRSIDESERLSARIQQEIQSGNPESAEKWIVLRRDHFGK